MLTSQMAQQTSEDIEDSDDDDDDHSSIVSIETKPNPAASLIKHSIANILSDKISNKHKRPFSSSSLCKFQKKNRQNSCFSFSSIFLASTDESINNKRPKVMAC